MKSQIPGRVPWIFPGIRHGDHVRIVEMPPIVIAAELPRGIGRRLGGIAVQPSLDVIVIALLAPKQSRESLSLDETPVHTQLWAGELGVKFIRLFPSGIENAVECRAEKFLVGRPARRWIAVHPP